MKNEKLRKVEYAEIGEAEYRKLSPLEKTKAAIKKEKKEGYFHGWSTDTIVANKESGDLQQVFYATHAIIEQPDGTIIKIKPENIKFID